ncbi:MAG: hypothetical protein JXA15_11105, partial [Spirochaetales bacterium]|nr:hypothetical protein [Spirochaetales bacterium]
SFDPALCVDEKIEVPVSVNGKLRDKLVVAPGTAEKELEALALASPKIAEWTAGKQVAKVIVVKDRMVNVVVK